MNEEDLSPQARALFPKYIEKVRMAEEINRLERSKSGEQSGGQMCRSRILGTLPRKNTELKFFSRTTDKVQIELAGTARRALPSGIRGRKTMAVIDTHAYIDALHKRRLYLGFSGRDVTKIFGFCTLKNGRIIGSGGKIVQETFQTLSDIANSTFYVRSFYKGGVSTKPIRIFSNSYLPEDEKKGGKKGSEYFVEIAQEYIDLIKIDNVPIDLEYYLSLTSATFMDYYCYFNYVLHPFEYSKDQIEISDCNLFTALGPIPKEGISVKRYQTMISDTIADIMSYLTEAKQNQFPFANLDFKHEGGKLILLSGRSHVAPVARLKREQGRRDFIERTH